MEVNTGKVVAMASMPDYDPNVWQGGVSTETLNAIMPFIGNGTIREVYPPYDNSKERAQHPTSLVPLGSTQKPLTILVGLSEKLITPNTRWKDPGYFEFGSKGHEVEIQNAGRAANGYLTPTMAIAKSSNAFMAANVPLLLKGLARVTQEGGYVNAYACDVDFGLWRGLFTWFRSFVVAATPGNGNEVWHSPICR